MIMLMKTLIIENPRVGGSIPPLGTIYPRKKTCLR